MFMQNFIELSAAVHENHELSCVQRKRLRRKQYCPMSIPTADSKNRDQERSV